MSGRLPKRLLPSFLSADPKKVFGLVAVSLTVMLAAMVAYMAYTLSRPLQQLARDQVDGLQPMLVLVGPGRGRAKTFSRPLGAAFAPNGDIYVADSGNDRICVFDHRGVFRFEFGRKGVLKPAAGIAPTWKPGRLNFPTAVDVDENGEVYVADFGNDQIQVFDARGDFLRSFPDPLRRVGKGASGRGGMGIAVTDIAVSHGLVYATDSYQVVVFDVNGRLVRQFGKPGRGPQDLDHPSGIAVGEQGTIYISDSNHSRLIAFSPTGRRIWTRGGIPRDIDDATGDLGLPRGVVELDDGRVLVVDAFNFEIVKLSRTGEIIDRHGSRGVTPASFNYPNDIDALGDLIVVADKDNDRVQVLKLVK